MTKKPTTEELVGLCERAVVPVNAWSDRDTPRSQEKIGKAWALLRAGCAWRLAKSPESTPITWWIEITHPTFSSIEEGDPDLVDDELFYIPTQQKLDASSGKDWY